MGESWQVLAPDEKEAYEAQASAAKEKYHAELVTYKKTDEYKAYGKYLTEFKAKNASNSGPPTLASTPKRDAAADPPPTQR